MISRGQSDVAQQRAPPPVASPVYRSTLKGLNIQAPQGGSFFSQTCDLPEHFPDSTRNIIMWRLALFILGLLITCWLGMMLVHECGHMLAAICSGGAVARLEWPAWGFSRTDVSPNPHPLLVVWAGPLFGAVLPLLLSLALRGLRIRSVIVEIFSGFCLLANGIYLSAGSFDRIGDTADLLKFGCPILMLWVVGLPLAVAGLAQWHTLGPALGISRASKTEMYLAAALGGILLAASIIWQSIIT